MLEPTNQSLYRKAWHRVTDYDRLLLFSASNLGLPVDYAGKLLNIPCTNFDRVLKDFHAHQQKTKAWLVANSSLENVRQYDEKMAKLAKEVELDAVLRISTANHEGQI